MRNVAALAMFKTM